METWIYQPPHVGYHGKLHANYSLDVIVSTKKLLLLKHTLDLLCTYLKESSHLKCSFQHDISLGFLDKRICKLISSIQSINTTRNSVICNHTTCNWDATACRMQLFLQLCALFGCVCNYGATIIAFIPTFG
jgi:hypothetical protein